MKESKKLNPDRVKLNNYLNMEFPARRDRIKLGTQEYRTEGFFKMYPCFSDPVEVRFFSF